MKSPLATFVLGSLLLCGHSQAAFLPAMLRQALPPGEDCHNYQTCAEASLARKNYVDSDCQKVTNEAQDRCASLMINRKGYVDSDCFRLTEGSRCAEISIQRKGYIDSDCFRVNNYRQDRCAAATLQKNGYVDSDCLKLP